ncbi:MAG: hypothetical protein LUE17_00225 [Planctomycetaceae bacterium]|nr:hypothetical protein [Planctomycetaceae bacterium]
MFDNGPLGLFLAYLLHREHKRDKLDADNREAEEKQRKEVGERFQALDNKFINVIEKYSSSTTEVNTALRGLQGGLRQIINLMVKHYPEGAPMSGTRVIHRDDETQ